MAEDSEDFQTQPLTLLLRRARQGDSEAVNEVYRLVYPHLRRLAQRCLNGEGKGHSFQPSDLVNEAFLKMRGHEVELADRQHFFAFAARAIRQVLVEHARSKGRVKRGGNARTIYLEDDQLHIESTLDLEEILDLHIALDELARRDAKMAQMVELRFFAGLTREEAANEMGVSGKSIYRYWVFAQTWLKLALRPDDGAANSATS